MLSIKSEHIKQDGENIISKVNRAVRAGLNAVASDMSSSLFLHIQKDVYAMYTPQKYKRRKADGGMLDPSNIDISFPRNNELQFSYTMPTKVDDWYYYQDGDDAIRAIQSGEFYPTHTPDNMPSRGFWENFINEQFVTGVADISLAKGMNAIDAELHVKSDRNTEVENADYGGLSDIPAGKIENGYSPSDTIIAVDDLWF